jgi:hypothetical protein
VCDLAIDGTTRTNARSRKPTRKPARVARRRRVIRRGCTVGGVEAAVHDPARPGGFPRTSPRKAIPIGIALKGAGIEVRHGRDLPNKVSVRAGVTARP